MTKQVEMNMFEKITVRALPVNHGTTSTETEFVVQRLDVINRLARRRWAHEAPPLSSFMDTNPT